MTQVFDDPTYDEDCYNYKRASEASYQASPYLDANAPITPRTRFIVIDWIADLTYEYGYEVVVFHRAVNYFDRFMAKRPEVSVIPDVKFIGVACFYLACKFEILKLPRLQAIFSPNYDDDTKKAFYQWEMKVASSFGFDFTAVTISDFIPQLLRITEADQETRELAHYLGDLSLLEYECIKIPPSIIAAGAVSLSRTLKGFSEWTPQLSEFTRYTPTSASFRECVIILKRIYSNAPSSEFNSIYLEYEHRCKSIMQLPQTTLSTEV